MSDFHIPVDSAIDEFSEHLRCHPRTILSAKYGDGKSYFIDSFISSEKIKKEYQFIKIYPVNYQVLENQDIFEVVKYDILLQLGLNDMLGEEVEVSSRDAFLFCLKTKGLDLLGSLFEVAGSIEGSSSVKAIGKIGSSATKVVNVIKAAAEEYKKYKKGDAGIIDNYIAEIDGVTIYEEDLITKIIQKNISAWRKKKGNENKKVVLILEDMDRIDPAHLFRILNIFSAHMDFSYRYQMSPDKSLIGNKFGVDNVVMVIDYDNLQSIFHHFYGEKTCFEGYIHKFADKGKFVYSLKAESYKYFFQTLQSLTNIQIEYLRQTISIEFLFTKTLRELCNSLEDIRSQCKTEGSSFGIVVLMACMRRMGIADDEIVSTIRRSFFSDTKSWLKFLYPCLKYYNKLEGDCVYVVNDDNRNGYYFQYTNGEINIGITSFSSAGPLLNISDFLKEILLLVIK
ncbi:MAG: hypothetical protein KBT27_08610 [Prevotellaceae bacterium]|nr:hypothetical protein [Candidatus Faecinaster equi]